MNEPFATHQYNGLTIELCYDHDPPNPRKENENLGIMVCWHSRYELGDRQDDQDCLDDDETVLVQMPLYLYDHSGLSMSVGDFRDRFDSGFVGKIYTTKDRVKEWWGEDVPPKERLIEVLTAEVKEYDCYLRGAYCGYVIRNKYGTVVNSCWGFADDDDCLAEAKLVCNGYIPQDHAKWMLDKVKYHLQQADKLLEDEHSGLTEIEQSVAKACKEYGLQYSLSNILFNEKQ